jgi:folate-binding protein YgfZ
MMTHSPEWSADYEALTRGVGLVDVSSNVQIELTGKDAPAFLNRLCTQQVDGLPPGSGCEAFLTNARGHIMAHVLVFCGIQSRLLHASGVRAATIREHLQQYLVRDQVEIHDRGGEWCEFRLAGKQAESLLTEMTSAPIPAADLDHANMALAGSEVSVRRHAWGDIPGFLIAANADLAGSVGNALRQAGARPCNPWALESLRIEAGWPTGGVDITEDNLPQEVGRDRQAISYSKGCYLGQEIVARIASRGHVNRTLAGVAFERWQVPPRAAELTAAGRPAGRVTSAAFSPRLGSALALAYVACADCQPGTRLESPCGPARIVSLPLSHA